MIEVNDRWSIDSSPGGFTLIESWTVEDDGEEKERENRTYHSTLMQCLKKIRRKEAGRVDEVDELTDALETSFDLDREEVEDVVPDRYENYEIDEEAKRV